METELTDTTLNKNCNEEVFKSSKILRCNSALNKDLYIGINWPTTIPPKNQMNTYMSVRIISISIFQFLSEAPWVFRVKRTWYTWIKYDYLPFIKLMLGLKCLASWLDVDEGDGGTALACIFSILVAQILNTLNRPIPAKGENIHESQHIKLLKWDNNGCLICLFIHLRWNIY